MSARLRLAGAFCRVRVLIDHLQIRQSPEAKQCRPVLSAVLAPNPEQRHAMVDLGGFPEPTAGCGASALLQPLEHLGVIAGGGPQPPGRDASRLPPRPPHRSASP